MSKLDRTSSGMEAPIPGSYEERLIEAHRLENRGEFQEALAILERICGRVLRLPERRRQPDSDLWFTLLAATALMADIKAKTGDIAAADALWEQLEQWDTPDRLGWRRVRILHHIELGEVEVGLSQLLELAEEEPDNIENWLVAAWSAHDAGQVERAEAWMLQAEPLLDKAADDDEIASFYVLRYRLNAKNGLWREALDDWCAAMELQRSLVEYIEPTLRELLAAEQYDLALELLEDEAFITPLAQFYQAWIAQYRGDKVRARHLWRQVVAATEDEEIDLSTLKAVSLCWLKRPLEAVAIMLQEVSATRQLDPLDATALALAWGMEGRIAEARANLAVAIRDDSEIRLLTKLQWYDFDKLITDELVKAELREYFDLDDEPAVLSDAASGE